MANNSNNRNGGSNGPRNRNTPPGNVDSSRPTATSDRPASPAPKPPVNNNGPRRLTPKQEAMLRRQRVRRRNQLIITSLLVVAVVALIGIILYVANTSSQVAVTNTASASTADTALYTIGDPNAKVTLTEWGDFRCSACDLFFNDVEPTIMSNYVKTNKIKLVFKNYITIDPPGTSGDSHRAAEAGWCAADQSHFWDFYQAVYSNYPGEASGYWTADRLKNVASKLGLDTNKFNTCLDSGTHRQDVNNQNQQASQNNFKGTPTLTINDKPMTANFGDVKGVSAELDAAILAANGATTPGATAGANGTPGASAAATTAAGVTTTVAGAAPTSVVTTTTVAGAAPTSAVTTTVAANGTPGATPTK